MKRAIALFLALVFVFTLIPVSALAADATIEIKYEAGAATDPDTKERTVVPQALASLSDPADSVLADDNLSVTVKAPDTDADGKTLQYWKIGSSGKVSASSSASYTAIHTINSNVNVTPVYGNKLTLTVTDGTGGDTYADGESIHVTANTPEPGETFVRWEVVSGDVSALTGFVATAAEFDAVAAVGDADVAVTLKAVFSGGSYDIDFATSGIAVANTNLGPGDSGWSEAPAQASAGERIYVRVAANTTQPDRVVSGITVTTAGGDSVSATLVAGQNQNGLSTYWFDMPADDVTISANYQYKVTLYGATGSFNGGQGGASSILATPGTTVKIILDVDAHGRTVSNWVFAPALPTADMDPSETVTITNRTGPDIEKGIATFTMPSEPLAVTVHYDREIESYGLTVVNGNFTYDNAEGDTVTATTAQLEEGTEVSVTAVKPETIPTGYVFSEWQVTGDDEFVEYINDNLTLTDSTLDFDMPRGGGTLTAQYVGSYSLTTHGAAAYAYGSDWATGDADDVTVDYGLQIKIDAQEDTATPKDFVFDRWTFTPSGVSTPAFTDGTSATTAVVKFNMPASGTESGGSLTVTAHYKYLVTVQVQAGTLSNGETSGYFAPGETVTIVAQEPSAGQVFKSWIATGVTLTEANARLSTTTFTMPTGVVTLDADFDTAYTATTNSNATIRITGQAAGRTAMKAAEGTPLTAVASPTITTGGTTKAFKQWIVTNTSTGAVTSLWADAGGTTMLGQDAAEQRIMDFYMPDENVTIMPEYVEGCSVTVTNGTGTGYYANLTPVTIEANEIAGKEFAYWEFTYYANQNATQTTTTQVAGSSYTFVIGQDVNRRPVRATAVYTQLYSLTLQNAQASDAGDLKMTRTATTVAPIIPAKTVESEAGQTSLSAYWKSGNVITITTPPTVPVDGTAYTFTNWRLVSGSGTIANATSATTTFTMTTKNAVVAAQYGGNMLIYKTQERSGTGYDNWEYANYGVDDPVQMTADDPNNTFVRWACEPDDLIRDADKGNRTISFNMPEGTAKIWPEYGHKLTLTDGEYSLDGTTWTLGGGLPVAVTTGDIVRLRPVEDTVGSGTAGKLLFKSWRTNMTNIIDGSKKEITFAMPPEDVEAAVVYQTYTLTVYSTVDGTAETHQLHPGEYFTITSEEATGGRRFNYWTHTNGLRFTVVNDKFDEKDPNRLVSQRITVQMPASNAFIHAWYELYPRYDYWNTDAFIRVEGEPKRYYARLEYFRPYDMKVIYYSSLTAPGVEVDPQDYRLQIVKAGTTEVATTADHCFTQEGVFDILVTMIVNGRQMAPTIRAMNLPSTHLYCTATRAEFVQAFTKPARTVYFENESVSKDGLDVLLRSADHTDGTARYSTVREIDESEYKLKPWGTGWDADGHTNTKLPTLEEIDAKIAAGKFGYKIEDGRYYVCMEITDCFDYTQYNTDGSYMRMEYIVNDATDYIWVEVRKAVNSITLEAIPGDNSGDIVNNVASTTYPFVSWEIHDDLATAQSGIRKLKINADGYTDKRDIAASMEYVNSDSNVAYLEPTNDPLVYNVKLKNTGVTTITFRALGNYEINATCEITVKAGAAIRPMMTFPANGLNKSRTNLYVGSKLTLYPVVFTPSDANTTCNWVVEFTDGLQPQNADYYVSVSEGGVVEVLKYTDRPVRVWAFPAYPLGQNTIDKAKANPPTGLYAYCDITVLQIPVDNMTLYPAALTLHRLASTNLKATMYPEAASNKTIQWSSSDSSVASVDNNGYVTANKLGTATITARSESNQEVYQVCKVTVVESVLLTRMTLNKTSATLGIEDTLVLTPYYTPSNATTKKVNWESNATTVATVDANGKVRGISEGVAVITATATDGSRLKASCVVSVSNIVSSAVVLNKQTLALIEDESETLVATVYPTNVSNAKVHWTSSNENVAVVDPDGVVTATGGGSAVITATAKDASTKYADCVVAVAAKIPVTDVKLNLGNFDILLNDTTVLTTTVSPANATYKTVWSSSDNTVASIDEKGKLSALKLGSAVITCKAGDMTKAITVNVVTKTFSTGKVVNCARRVNVRASGNGTSTILGYAYLGDVYKVLDKTGNWYKIQYNATTQAYIWSRYLNATETSAGYTSAGKVGSTTTDGTTTTTPVPAVTAKTLTITNCDYCVNVRSGAGTGNPKLGYAYKDEVFTYTGTSGDWYIITYNGATAYVSGQFVKVNN